MADATAELEILVQIKAAIANLDALKQEAKAAAAATKEIQTSAQAFASGATQAFNVLKTAAIAAVGVLAGRAVFNFFHDAIDAAAEEESALNALRIQLALTGEESATAVQHFKDFAEGIQNTTKFDSDLIIQQLALAKSFGITNDQAETLVKAATELSAATGTDLATAVQTLGKTFAGTTGKLDEQIPALKNLTKAQLAAGDALKIVIDRFGGAAAGEIETFSGAVARLENTFGDLQKAVGRAIVDNPVLVASINEITRALGLATSEVESSDSALTQFVNGAINGLLASLSVGADLMATFAGALKLINSSVNASVGGILTLTSYVDDLNNAVQSFLGAPATVKPSESLAVALNEAQLAADDALTAIQDGAKEAGKGIDGIAQRINDAAGQQQEATNKIVNQSKVRKKNFEDEGKALKKALVGPTIALDELIARRKEALLVGPPISEAQRKQIEAQKQAIEDATKAAEDAAQRLKDKLAGLAENPIKIIFEAEITGKEATAAALGIADAMLSGAEGAKKLIADGAGAIADRFLPGIGGIVSSIVGKLAAGPEAAKAFVKEFILAIPDILINIVEALPAVVEAFVDTLVNRGGAVRIGIALFRAFSGAALWEYVGRQIGKQVGLEFGDSFRSPQIRRTLADAFQEGGLSFSEGSKNLGANIADGFKRGVVDSALAFKTALANIIAEFHAFPTNFAAAALNFQNAGHQAGVDIKAAFTGAIGFIRTQLPGIVSGGFKQGVTAFVQGVSVAVNAFINLFRVQIPAAFQAGADNVINSLRTNIVPVLAEAFGKLTAGFQEAVKNLALPTIPTPPWLQSFIDSVNSLVNAGNPGAEGGGGFVGQVARGDVSFGLAGGGGGTEAIAGGQVDTMVALLLEIAGLLRDGQTVSTSVKFNSKTLADIILELDRRGARTAA